MVGGAGENAMESTVSSPPELYSQQQPATPASLPLIQQQQQQQQLMQNRYQQQRGYHHHQQHRASECILLELITYNIYITRSEISL